MTPDWTPLERELAQWARAGITLPLWWRDDDAVATGRALDRLTDMAEAHDIPVHLAVIPHGATQGLADFVQDRDHLIAVVHGWAHANHAPPGRKKAEFGDDRPLAVLRGDAGGALARLDDLFASRLCPMFVPPWNRVGRRLPGALGPLGYACLSTFTPRSAPYAAPGLMQVNTHLDPISWKEGRGLANPERLIAQLVDHLGKRRKGQADNTEPYGILTHHLVHDDDIWGFAGALLSRLAAGPVKLWDARDQIAKGRM